VVALEFDDPFLHCAAGTASSL